MPARSNLNSIKTSHALTDSETSHKEFKTNINESKNRKKWKKILEW